MTARDLPHELKREAALERRRRAKRWSTRQHVRWSTACRSPLRAVTLHWLSCARLRLSSLRWTRSCRAHDLRSPMSPPRSEQPQPSCRGHCDQCEDGYGRTATLSRPESSLGKHRAILSDFEKTAMAIIGSCARNFCAIRLNLTTFAVEAACAFARHRRGHFINLKSGNCGNLTPRTSEVPTLHSMATVYRWRGLERDKLQPGAPLTTFGTSHAEGLLGRAAPPHATRAGAQPR